MYQTLGRVTLKTGESVEAGVVTCPDTEWADRILALLAHKNYLTTWQNKTALTQPLNIETYFYVLHRDGIPFANITTVELSGVGIFGHVWTTEAERQKGASSSLMALQMAHFRERGGQALYLVTGFESTAYWMYQKMGFESIEAGSRYMAFYASTQAQFEENYFHANETEIQPFGWSCWPSSCALFAGSFPGLVRSAPLGLIGRMITEEPFLPLLYDATLREQEHGLPRAKALRSVSSGAVLGLALWQWHPIWPDVCLIDVYCHPDYWERAPELYQALTLPDAQRYLAYVDDGFMQKRDLLQSLGFHPTVTLKNYVATSALKNNFADVVVFEK
jgi:N-acetylglutamate synthase-like GNAT family acetyltransferase